MTNESHNARVRLTASAINHVAAIVTAAGIAYLVLGTGPLPWRGLAALAAASIGVLLHGAARRHLRRLKPGRDIPSRAARRMRAGRNPAPRGSPASSRPDERCPTALHRLENPDPGLA